MNFTTVIIAVVVLAVLGAVFGLVLGVTGACAAMLYISIISAVKAVGV